ncbi:MAG: hypothetical protein ACR2QI_04140 [Woeseiaceae bacterium]
MREEFLEYSILSILLNPSLYEYLQEMLEESIRYAPSPLGERILAFVLEEAKEHLTGPDEVSEEDLEKMKANVAFKMAAYKRTGNHDD